MRKELPIELNLPANYLEQEERCGFTVTKERKELWAVELDLLHQLDKACKEIGVRYYASGGTTLGAVRHEGFIPWDDDIDLYIFRDDYNKLCEHAERLFSYPYFFQTEWTDPGSTRGHAQLRNSETTAILKSEMERHFDFNQGIFIDIFPVDNVPDNANERKVFANKLYALKRKASIFSEVTERNLQKDRSIKTLIKKGLRLLAIPYYKKNNYKNVFYERFEKEAQRYNGTSCNECGEIVVKPGNPKTIHKRVYFDECILMPFEMLTIPVSKQYDIMLATQYGDWKEIVKSGSLHGELFVDPHKSYREYI